MNRIDLTGQQFGGLIVISFAYKSEKSHFYWNCKCFCGNLKIARENHLLNGRVKFCGCMRKDITGERFGNVVVLGISHLDKNKKVFWNCLCDCGNEVVFPRKSFRSARKNGKLSCGCVYKKQWKPIDYGEYYGIPLTNGKIALIDKEDFPLVKDLGWIAHKMYNEEFYATSKKNGKTIKMHILIMNPPEGMMVDHKNHNTLDNRRENLRVCTRSQNGRNRKFNINKKSKGVQQKNNRWRAVIGVGGGKRKHIGYFIKKEDAQRAYDEAAAKHHGEFAAFNFPDEWELVPGEGYKKKNATPEELSV